MANKPCTQCGRLLPDHMYSKDRSKANGLRSACKDCMKRMDRSYKLKAAYGITMDDYDDMLVKQDYRCGCCGKHADMQPKQMAVDHCHYTGLVRGLLCSDCNLGIGKLGDSIEGLQRALKYLEGAYADNN